MASPGDGIVRPSFKVVWVVGSLLSLVVLAYIAYGIGSAVEQCDAIASPTSGECHIPIGKWTKLAYAVWTVGVPVYFMIEWVYGINWKFALDPKNKPGLDYVKTTQDQARTIWAAFAAALGILLLKYG